MVLFKTLFHDIVIIWCTAFLSLEELVPPDKLEKLEGFGACGGLKYNLLVKTDKDVCFRRNLA